jgi:predicted GNAT family acetyltransferase
MVALTDVAFPGFFRRRTCVMGSYFGIWNPARPGQLIAMAGERLVLHPHREISGICTHPDHRGHGYAAALTTHVLHHQRSLQARSVLHVVSTNHSAINLYHRLGFEPLREVQLYRLKRAD